MNIPTGWQLVPAEPTPLMAATFRADNEHGAMTWVTHTGVQCVDFDSRYRAMIAAAPVPPCAPPVVSSAGIEQACQRYAQMLLDKHPTIVAAQADTSRSGLPPLWHILQMLKQIPTLSPAKAHRWLGFVQCALVSHGLTNIDAEREATRGMFDEGAAKQEARHD
ncbi:hypothetical protein [Isoalcanivorax beigongshangi]|uniref:Uncharacterized protein n=1 Tax=Isoalcanivorax beigongshangi TaxID=3238810 RepID=A0ABV4AI97_9GAMM